MKNRGRFGVYFIGSVADPRETKKYVFIKRNKVRMRVKGGDGKGFVKAGEKEEQNRDKTN